MEPRDGWIGGRSYDLFFFYFPSALAIAAGAACLSRPWLVAPIWWLWVWLVEGPHLFATFTRTYFDARERRERRELLLGSLLCFVPGLLIWASGSPSLFQGLLAVAAVYSYFHGVRQHYGVMALYHRFGASSVEGRREDWLFMHGSLAAFFILPLFMFAPNRALLGLPAELPRWASLAVDAALAALGLYVARYAWGLRARLRGGLSIKPALFALLPTAGLGAVCLFLVGPREPLFLKPVSGEQLFLAVTFMGGIFHGVEYLGVVFLVNKRRYETSREPGLWAALGRRPALAYLVFVVLSLSYVALNGLRGVGPGYSFFAPDSRQAQLFLALYWGLFFHHYYLDQRIWRVQESPSLRVELGVAAPAAA